MNKNNAIQALSKLLKHPKKILITMHQRPDGDALGSAIGLSLFLKKMGHYTTIISPTNYDPVFAWMPDINSVIAAPLKRKLSALRIKEADLIFCLDFSALSRAGILADAIEKSEAQLVLIDHHRDPDERDWITFHDTTAAATAQLIYELITGLQKSHYLDKEIATCLYTGIMTDTGSFRFPATTAAVHRMVAELLARGVEIETVHRKMYSEFQPSRNKFLGYCLYEKMKVLPEYHTAYMMVSEKEQQKFEIGEGGMEGFVNYTLDQKGINFGVLFKEKEGLIRISFRSVGTFSSNDFAKHFDGGGHHNAAGGKSLLSLEETEKRFLSLLEECKKQLQYE